jgi:hypothetical protein
MTPAERALLMAVADRMTLEVRGATTLRPLIAAVEAESAKNIEDEYAATVMAGTQSCETCKWSDRPSSYCWDDEQCCASATKWSGRLPTSEAAFAADDEAELAEVAEKAMAIENIPLPAEFQAFFDAPIPPASALDGWQPSHNRPLGEPCRSCTGHIRENNPLRCAECSPTAHQNYERSLWQEGEDR